MTDMAETAGPTMATPAPVRPRLAAFTNLAGGVAAIGVKELRGRMRGRRAFVIVTIYLLLLAGFALMVERLMEQSFTSGFGGSSAFAGAAIGQGIFAGLLMLMTLQVVFLAASSTAGGISLEREKQTLELLVATPISSLAIVVGKLLSALVYVFLLIAASVPLMAVVFVYGGVAPEDVARGYIVLLVTSIGLGSFGLLCSSLVKRTTAATALTIFGVLAVTIGTVFILFFWQAMTPFDQNGVRRAGPLGIRSPEPLAWINPFIAQADVLCGTESSFGSGWCGMVSEIAPSTNNPGVIFTDGPVAEPAPFPAQDLPLRGDDIAPQPGPGGDQPQPFGPQRDALWTRSVASWLVLSIIFVFASVQAVSPTRRWRLRRGARQRSSSS